jgi:hypothetical protein
MLVFAAGSVFAQTEMGGGKGGDVIDPGISGGWLIGPVGGLNLVTYKSDAFPTINSEPTCFLAQNGSDIAPFFGISAEIPLNADEMQQFIIVEVLFDSKSSKFSSISGSQVVPTKLDGVVGQGSVETAVSATLNYLMFNVGFKYNFTPAPVPVGPGVQACISAALPMSPKLDQTVTVTSGIPAVGSATVTNSNDVTNAAFRLGLRAQFTYDIPITEMWVATPFVGYDLPFTKVDNSTKNWAASSAFGGLAFRALLGR